MSRHHLPTELRANILSIRFIMRENAQKKIVRCWKNFDSPRKIAITLWMNNAHCFVWGGDLINLLTHILQMLWNILLKFYLENILLTFGENHWKSLRMNYCIMNLQVPICVIIINAIKPPLLCWRKNSNIPYYIFLKF